MCSVVPAERRMSHALLGLRPMFTCGHCAFELALAPRDMLRHEQPGETNLTQRDAEALEAAVAAEARPAWSMFLDFYCPGCHAPVRVYARADEPPPARPAALGYRALFVAEGSPRRLREPDR